MTGKEWTKKFEEANGRKPSAAEFQAAKENEFASVADAKNDQGFFTILKNYFLKTFKYSGTATRKEFWIGTVTGLLLSQFVLPFILGFIYGATGKIQIIQEQAYFATQNDLFTFNLISLIGGIVLLLPSISLAVRRMRDTGFHPAMVLVPFFNFIADGFFPSKGTK